MTLKRLTPSTANVLRLFQRGYALSTDNTIKQREPKTHTLFAGVPRAVGSNSRTIRTRGYKWAPIGSFLAKVKVAFAKNKQISGRIHVMIQRFPKARKRPEEALRHVQALTRRVEECTLLVKSLQFNCLELHATQKFLDLIWSTPYVYDQTTLAVLVLSNYAFGEREVWASAKKDVDADNDTLWHERRDKFRQRVKTVRHYANLPPNVSDPLTEDRLATLDHMLSLISTANCIFFEVCVGRGLQKLQAIERDLRPVERTLATLNTPDSERDTESSAIE